MWLKSHSKGAVHYCVVETVWLLIISVLPVKLDLDPQSNPKKTRSPADIKQNEQIDGDAFWFFQPSLKQHAANPGMLAGPRGKHESADGEMIG